MIELWPEQANIFARFYEKNISLKDFSKFLKPEVKIVSVKQVHGTEVLFVTKENASQVKEGDALITLEENIALTIHTADCLPLVAFAGEVIGACHAGWRGLSKGIIESWIGKMGFYGAKKDVLQVAIGPSIGPCHFEVGSEVAHQIMAGVPEKLLSTLSLKHPNSEKKYLDLRELARYKLLRLGISPENLIISKDCTHCDPERFHSFRRDGDNKGQRLEALILKPRH